MIIELKANLVSPKSTFQTKAIQSKQKKQNIKISGENLKCDSLKFGSCNLIEMRPNVILSGGEISNITCASHL